MSVALIKNITHTCDHTHDRVYVECVLGLTAPLFLVGFVG